VTYSSFSILLKEQGRTLSSLKSTTPPKASGKAYLPSKKLPEAAEVFDETAK